MKTVLINDQEFETVYQPLEWQKLGLQKTATGYGKKIPSTSVVKFEGRTRRIYTDIFSNSGVCYIVVKGEKIYVR